MSILLSTHDLEQFDLGGLPPDYALHLFPLAHLLGRLLNDTLDGCLVLQLFQHAHPIFFYLSGLYLPLPCLGLLPLLFVLRDDQGQGVLLELHQTLLYSLIDHLLTASILLRPLFSGLLQSFSDDRLYVHCCIQALPPVSLFIKSGEFVLYPLVM